MTGESGEVISPPEPVSEQDLKIRADQVVAAKRALRAAEENLYEAEADVRNYREERGVARQTLAKARANLDEGLES